MKRAMLVSVIEGKHEASFYDDTEKAVADADVINVCLGGYAEVYERQEPGEENDYDDSYVCVYCG